MDVLIEWKFFRNVVTQDIFHTAYLNVQEQDLRATVLQLYGIKSLGTQDKDNYYCTLRYFYIQ